MKTCAEATRRSLGTLSCAAVESIVVMHRDPERLEDAAKPTPRRGSMLRKQRFWQVFLPCFILGGPLFGWLAFMATWGEGMKSFGAPSGGVGIPLRTFGIRTEYVMALVGVLCAAVVAFAVAAVGTRDDD